LIKQDAIVKNRLFFKKVNKKLSMKKIKKSVKIIVGIFIFLFLSNIPPLQTLFQFFFDQKLYHYSTKDGSAFFDENIFLGNIFEFKRVTPQGMRERYPEADTIIYRNFKLNPYAFWRYRDYLNNERYTLPYYPLEEAQKKRQEWKKKMSSEGRAY
jgi:hypothetical protein